MPNSSQPKSTEIITPEKACVNFEHNFEKAVTLHENGKVKEAMKLYRALFKQVPNNPKVLNALAIALYQQDRVDDALPFAERAVEEAPKHPEYYNSLGIILRNMRRPEDAAKAFEKALDLKPEYFEALSNLGLIYGDMQKPKEAVEQFKKALKLAPNHPDVLINLAHALRDTGEEKESVQYYQKLVELEPENTRHLYNLAIVLHALEDYEGAVKYLEKVVALDPKDVNAQHLLDATRGDNKATAVPDEFISDLFDHYANEFDHHLKALGYEVPAMLAARIPRVVAPGTKEGRWNLLDLGCGTGACGKYFNEYCRHMVGIDLAQKMVDKAAEHGIYDELYAQSITDYFDQSTALFDLIIAADVLVYIGDIEQFFAQAADHLKPGGILAFSTETCTPEEGDFILRNSGRFAQSDNYVLRLTKQYGLKKQINADITVRMGHNEPIPGKLYILKK